MKRAAGARRQAGITLIEMLMVSLLLSLLVGITFPAVSSGVESLRLRSAADSIAGFLNAALNWAERRQDVVEIVISTRTNELTARSARPGLFRRLDLPEGVSIANVHPAEFAGEEQERSVLVYPGSAPPRVGIEIVNRKQERRTVWVDPTTGVPIVERPEVK
jgi:type II secretory pathway pseudopilin PulG